MFATRAAFCAGLIAAMVAGSSIFTDTAFAQSTQPGKSPLKRTKTKLNKPAPRPASKPTTKAPKSSKPLSGLKPTGRTPGRNETADGVEGLQRWLVGDPSLRRAIRGNTTGGDINVELDRGVATVSPVFTGNGMPSQDQAMRNVVDAYRDGRRPASGEEMRGIIRGNTRDVDDVRGEYLAKGYQEVRLSSGETVFVKASDPADTRHVANMVQNRVSMRMYETWRDGWWGAQGPGEWIYNGGVRTCSGGTCSRTRQLDSFILRGTIREPSFTEAELAELDMTDAERAEAALLRHDFDLAADRYHVYVKHTPDDAPALRNFGVALLQAKRIPDGIEKIADAYRLDPTLAAEPIDLAYFADGADAVTGLLQRIVPMAHRSPNYHAALASAALMQAQGRTREAARMLERAKSKGLPESIEREFELAGAPSSAGK